MVVFRLRIDSRSPEEKLSGFGGVKLSVVTLHHTLIVNHTALVESVLLSHTLVVNKCSAVISKAARHLVIQYRCVSMAASALRASSS